MRNRDIRKTNEGRRIAVPKRHKEHAELLEGAGLERPDAGREILLKERAELTNLEDHMREPEHGLDQSGMPEIKRARVD